MQSKKEGARGIFGGFFRRCENGMLGRPNEKAARREAASQTRSRFFRTTEIKTAIKAMAMSIQYWPSIPKKEKCSTRNCNASSPPFFKQDKRFAWAR
jgi:hypothetical protein